MESADILWVDARLRPTSDDLLQDIKNYYNIDVISINSDIICNSSNTPPKLIIFDFDFPDLDGLHALQQTKQAYNGVPVLMLTREHSENLAVWALRTRVWDYLVKPFQGDVLLDRIKLLYAEQPDENDDRARTNFMPIPPIPMESRFRNQINTAQNFKTTCSYVETHLHEKIQEETVAQLCGMSCSEFSRAFKRDQGTTFRDYLVNSRVQRAANMLSKTNCSVTDAAFSVGFRDLSHFARLFRRTMGCSPREYRVLQSD